MRANKFIIYRNAPLIQPVPLQFDDIADVNIEIDQFLFIGGHPGEIQQVFDDPARFFHGFFNDFNGFLPGGHVIFIKGFQHITIVADQSQRVSNFMSHARCQLAYGDHLVVLKHLPLCAPLIRHVLNHQQDFLNLAAGVFNGEGMGLINPTAHSEFRVVFLFFQEGLFNELGKPAARNLVCAEKLGQLETDSIVAPDLQVLGQSFVDVHNPAFPVHFCQVIGDAVKGGLHFVLAFPQELHPLLQFFVQALVRLVKHKEYTENSGEKNEDDDAELLHETFRIKRIRHSHPFGLKIRKHLRIVHVINGVVQDFIKDMVFSGNSKAVAFFIEISVRPQQVVRNIIPAWAVGKVMIARIVPKVTHA